MTRTVKDTATKLNAVKDMWKVIDYYIFELWMIVTDVDLQCYLTGNQLVEDITFMIKN